MRVSQWKSLLALLFAFALVAAACSGDEVSDAVDDVEEAAEGAAEEVEEAAEEVAEEAEEAMEEGEEAMEEDSLAGAEVIITSSERSDAEVAGIQAALDAFSEETGIIATYAGSADWEAEINIAVEAGNPPDISFFPQPGKLADFARAGELAALSDDVVATASGNWSDSWMIYGNVDGTQFGVPVKSDLKSLVWYEPARFAELGYEVPETWDEFKALVDTAIADGNTPLCVGIESGQATGWPFTDWVEDLMLRFHGPDVYDAWVANDVKFADEQVIQVFDEINALWSTPGAVFASGGNIAATNFGDNGTPLVEDDCLMHRQASFFAAFMPEGTTFGPDGVDVFYFPDINGDRPVLGAGQTAAAFNDDPATMAVMEYLSTPEYANRRQAAQQEALGGGDASSGFLTAVAGADLSLWAPLEQSMMGVLADSAIFRFDGSDLMPADVGAGTFWSEGTSFVNGDQDAATAAAAIDASWPS